MLDPRLSIDEVFNEAIMSGTPVIIVEGIDDIKTYQSIASAVDDRIEVYAIETIAGWGAGCDSIIAAIRELYALQQNPYPVDKFILGIVDRDVREFRNELPAEPAFLVLDFYSIETHFVTFEVLERSVAKFTLAPLNALGHDSLQDMYLRVESNLLDLYYFSLEALKCATVQDYVADYKYSYANNRRKEQPAKQLIGAKTAELDIFAVSRNLQRSMGSLRRFAKGKWLLLSFAEEVYRELTNLSAYCGHLDTPRCQFCNAQIMGKCTFKLKDGISNKTIYSLAFEDTDLPTLDYIKARIRSFSDCFFLA